MLGRPVASPVEGIFVSTPDPLENGVVIHGECDPGYSLRAAATAFYETTGAKGALPAGANLSLGAAAGVAGLSAAGGIGRATSGFAAKNEIHSPVGALF